ncbi:hypothetical protein [Secundilactobacillus kimchicus]|uniref:hypothetical protein n=1 Tax=Secundilactobacillus kimchicus TaxID=528209 RepID=UPI0024369200|nr:hypothetical protein [Secundilactobacillus kimchicus]
MIGLYAKKTDAKAKKAKHAVYPKFNDKPNLKLNSTDFANKYGAAKFAKQYHLDQLTKNGQTGQGQRIGIITLAADMNVKDAQTYWRMVGAPASANRITKYYTDDQKAAVADYNQSMGFNDGQVEASLDVEQAGETAPGAKIDVYTAISENETEKMDQLYYNAFANAISANRDKQLSTSFSSDMEDAKLFSSGASETVQQLNQAFNIIFRQAAAQGISVFAASGDTGIWGEPASYENHPFSTSPYITVVGGTTLPYQYNIRGKDVNQPNETAWGDMISMGTKDIAGGHFAAGGGGFSELNTTPPYQLGVPGVNTFRAISLLKYQKGKYVVQKNPKVITGTKTGRNLPDVSGNADKTTGYAVYASGVQVMPVGNQVLTHPIKFWQVSGVRALRHRKWRAPTRHEQWTQSTSWVLEPADLQVCATTELAVYRIG